MSSLQDLLAIDLICSKEDEFDARKLEELAESLLADITASLEAGDGTSDEATSKATSETKCVSGSVVGTATELLESSEHIGIRSGDSLGFPADTLQTDADLDGNYKECTSLAIELPHTLSTPETVYGTYDAKTNSITIVMEDGSTPVNEAVEEIYCDGVAPPESDDVIKCPTPASSPSQVYLNIYDSDEDDDCLNFDPISKSMCPKRKLFSPLVKSPHSFNSAFSDHGYESIVGSPPPRILEPTESTFEEMGDFSWHENFNELFPTLI